MTTNLLLSSTIKSNPDPRATLVCVFLFSAAGGLRCPQGLSLVALSRGCSPAVVPGLPIAVASLSQCTGSKARGLSSCGILYSMWGLPRPGIEPVAPALAGICLTAGPPGEPPGDVDTSNLSPKLLVGGPPG